MRWSLCLLVLAVAFYLAKASNTVDNEEYYFSCPNLNSQDEIDLEKIMGKWYVVQVLEHRLNPLKPATKQYVVIDSCPTVMLRFYDGTTLKLLWKEDAGTLEYTFRIPDVSRRPGMWFSMPIQNGSLVERQYTQFNGTVHVMKAVSSDMVLTFCARQPNQFYSLLLGREHTLEKSNVRGVHNLLRRRGLDIISLRETCINGAGLSWRGDFLFISLSILASIYLAKSLQ
ncbi:uncharacterized protein [Prorops nasuta]|uniref:uncharacterized protein isoform X2 n=1 Tax=Prorops nasuta TaxID=863751 RepID=UPI0034CF7608